MKIKRYIVDSLPQAIQLIRQELGENAVILNTKEIKTGGIFGLFQRKQFEVIAASEAVKEKAEELSVTKQLQAESEVLKRLENVEKLLENFSKNEAPMAAKPSGKKLQKWLARLEEQEVDEEVIRFIEKKIIGRSPSLEELSEQQVGEMVQDTITRLFQDGIAPVGLDSEVNMITLLGPTGVGKTTTIAKLASRQVLYQRKKVGLLTADTFRIAAVEQLRTYANILNVPIEVADSPEHVKLAMERLEHCQMIFMDSAGRNYLEEQYIEQMIELLSSAPKQENHLVLSMTSRWKDMKQIVERMKSLQIDKVILTKWDESTCFGAALNLVYHYPYPISFLSLGQGVPEDIMLAEAQYMAKKIMGVDERAGSGAETERIVSAF
ncbi:AAA family ATPase [Neobacillus rhizophilus]|uniref:Flagellar biosynthesis protein FlhF n=1 Tax=Neobacillus rhizophilus TaxID=2833579 RepID=A0A942U5Z9_9BACI|nr:AAA family ATPase [Neobacillus rhizophilus]MBS4213056.1 AAA family ATPase [Neobacillus rhizophilus]